MKITRRKIIIGLTAGVAAVAAAAVPAVASSGEDDQDVPITGDELDRASQAALDHLGEGRVAGTEVGDEESYREIEVTVEYGSRVDVQLDENFTVVGSEGDDDSADG